MTNGKCPNCGSYNVYKSENTSWSGDDVNVQALGDGLSEVFATEAYLCVDCRHLQMHVVEFSAAIFGQGKPLKESIQVSTNWKKVN